MYLFPLVSSCDLHYLRAAARKKELRYKIANKNHLVPNITTNSSAEKALKKLATQGGIISSHDPKISAICALSWSVLLCL